MRRIIEDENAGLTEFLGQRITLFCANYIYTGKLTGVNTDCVELQDAAIVYETGAFSDTEWKDAQKLPNTWYVQKGMIESWGVLK